MLAARPKAPIKVPRVSSTHRSAKLGSYADLLMKADSPLWEVTGTTVLWSLNGDHHCRVPGLVVILVAPILRGGYRLRWYALDLERNPDLWWSEETSRDGKGNQRVTLAGLNANPVSILRRRGRQRLLR